LVRQPALAGDERLGGREAEHFGVSERADGGAVEARRAQCGVEDHRDAGPRHLLDGRDVARRAEHVCRHDGARAVEVGGGVVGVDLERAGRQSTKRRAPFHITAWADAENVKLGTTTGPARPSVRACTTSMSPDVQELRRDDVRDAEPFGHAKLELRDERPVGEHAELARQLEPPHPRSSGGRAGRTNGRPGERRVRRAVRAWGSRRRSSVRSMCAGWCGDRGDLSEARVRVRAPGYRRRART
jgi:hypothetical protein